MQLDKTRIVIRERRLLDILDLSLHVVHEYGRSLLITFVIVALPLFLLNELLLGWMTDVYYQEDAPQAYARFIWLMTLLVFLEAPLASTLSTLYLGQAMFLERPSVQSVVTEAFRLSPRWFFCQGIVRGTLPAWLKQIPRSWGPR